MKQIKCNEEVKTKTSIYFIIRYRDHTFIYIYIKGIVFTNLVYRKEIKGIIYKIDRGRGGDEFYYDLKNKGEFFSDEYFFNNRFSSGIKIGDSVYKSAHNDTLYIYKKT